MSVGRGRERHGLLSGRLGGIEVPEALLDIREALEKRRAGETVERGNREEPLEAFASLVEGTSRDPVHAEQICDAGSLVGEMAARRSRVARRLSSSAAYHARNSPVRGPRMTGSISSSRVTVMTCVPASEVIVLRSLA